MKAIEMHHLTKQYSDKQVIQDVSLSINRGELFSLLGVNGAGKSTLIKMLSGLLQPTSGRAVILGYDIGKETDQVKQIIAVSPQETAIAPNLSVYENLELMAGVHGFSKKERKRKVADMLQAFSLTTFAKQRSKTLSGGWKRRLSIAMALISEPEILFLDEPTLGLDILARRELWNVISGLKGKVTIILTTHYLEEAESLSDRICILKSGEVKALGTVEELKSLAAAASFEDAFVALVEEVAV
ncbi:ABC transporter ATP-binding protein [Sporosarcina sp. Te-1]|uniref:ABC transporter ATP-binding protein n=1 Tax=Sporosarcina sp. Te-1 TaxID=2818390 RepID=UPI001A9E11DF|nr:ABC transporter ATP-binding protein [Sporosarcina sp. Te-1]QTD39503.1 ABC transporter ATP-binding protein [Sporosarcina sp. Te-1]